MRLLAFAVLYLCLALGANADTGAIKELREGQMKKLIFHEAPRPVSARAFIDENDVEKTLSDYQGKYVVLNFWATWCAPCRKEMPSLSRLQAELGSDKFQVVTLATGRNSVTGIRRFFEETGVDNLPQYRDVNQGIAREMSVLGLPITMILNPEGEEIARLLGDAEWDTNSAKAIVSALVEQDG